MAPWLESSMENRCGALLCGHKCQLIPLTHVLMHSTLCEGRVHKRCGRGRLATKTCKRCIGSIERTTVNGQKSKTGRDWTESFHAGYTNAILCKVHVQKSCAKHVTMKISSDSVQIQMAFCCWGSFAALSRALPLNQAPCRTNRRVVSVWGSQAREIAILDLHKIPCCIGKIILWEFRF